MMVSIRESQISDNSGLHDCDKNLKTKTWEVNTYYFRFNDSE